MDLETAISLRSRVRRLIQSHSRATTTDGDSFDRLGRKIMGRQFRCVSLGVMLDRIDRTITSLRKAEKRDKTP